MRFVVWVEEWDEVQNKLEGNLVLLKKKNPRDDNFNSERIETPIPFVHKTISQEDTLYWPVFEIYESYMI